MHVERLGGPLLKIFTPVKFLVDFTQLPTLIANISGTRQDQKSERHVIEDDSFCVCRKRSGELWSTIHKIVHVSLHPPKSTFVDRLYCSP